MIYFGGKDIKEIYLGDKPIASVYLGGKLIWQSRVYTGTGVVITLQSDVAIRASLGVSYTVETVGGTAASHADPTLGSAIDACGASVPAIPIAAAPYMRHIAWSIAHGMLGSLGYAAPDQAGGSKNSALGSSVQAQAARPLCADGKRTASGLVLPQVEVVSGIGAEGIPRGGNGSATGEAAVNTTQANSVDTGTEKAVIIAQYRNNTRNAFATNWGLTAQAQMPVPAVRPHSGDCQAIQAANQAFFGTSQVKSANAVSLKESASCAAGGVADGTGIVSPTLPAHAAVVLPMGVACTPRTIVEPLNALDLLSLQMLDALPLDEWDALLVCT